MPEPLQLGRYCLVVELASGGMATVHLGRMSGAAGFGRTVAIKRLHPHLAREPKFVSSFVDEARLVARVHHPNVVGVLDVVVQEGEVFLVLEYVQGEPLGALLRAGAKMGKRMPVPICLSIILGTLNGLHAAHEAKDEEGHPLDIVHRDVSPQNIIAGTDGVARVLDFGIAKAAKRLLENTRQGQLKGKVPYMAPEQILSVATRQSDVYSAGVVLWEMLAGQRLFSIPNTMELFQAVLGAPIPPPSTLNPAVSPEVDRIVQKALARNPEERYLTAREMAEAIDACIDVASSMKVAQWVESVAGPNLEKRRELVALVERKDPATDPNPRPLFSPPDATAPMPPPSPEKMLAAMATIKMMPSAVLATAMAAQPSEDLPATDRDPRATHAARPRYIPRILVGAVGLILLAFAVKKCLSREVHEMAPLAAPPAISTGEVTQATPAETAIAVASVSPATPEPRKSPEPTPAKAPPIATEPAPATPNPAESAKPEASSESEKEPMAATALAPLSASTASSSPASTHTSSTSQPTHISRPDPLSSVADQVRKIMLQDPAGARKLLKPRVDSGKATKEEIVLYKTICKDQHDVPCVNQAKALLGEK